MSCSLTNQIKSFLLRLEIVLRGVICSPQLNVARELSIDTGGQFCVKLYG